MGSATDTAAIERDWLRGRAERRRAGVRPRDYGISSDALCEFALGGSDPRQIHALPNDRADLDACERAYAGAPAHLQPAMLPVLEAFRAHIADYETERAQRREQADRERDAREQARIAAGRQRRFMIEREVRTIVHYTVEADDLAQAQELAEDPGRLETLTPSRRLVLDEAIQVTELP